MANLTFNGSAHFSQLAARLERQEKYQEASDAWDKARKEAKKVQNQQWCLNRCEFCERMAERPFSKEAI